MKVRAGLFLLVCMPMAVAKNDKAYPRENLAAFVVDKLDVTSMPFAIHPKREKGKKTFGDYGYITRKIDANEALVENPQGLSQITITVLEENKSGIYVCLNSQEKQSGSQVQRVFLLKLKKGNILLKGRESWKEFDACPVMGGGNSDFAPDAYGGGSEPARKTLSPIKLPSPLQPHAEQPRAFPRRYFREWQ